ncbi:hypothetical protein F4859DRAFT_492037 [Xylaria cf. heliscus]|nr:hypothetical protein F4859DRAFT_492037 [Xylaria cf. heliscus]
MDSIISEISHEEAREKPILSSSARLDDLDGPSSARNTSVRLEQERARDRQESQRMVQGDEKLSKLAKLREKLDLFTENAPCPRCLFYSNEKRMHYMRNCREASKEVDIAKKLLNTLRSRGAGLAQNAGCFTCAMPKEWCNHWQDNLPTSDRCQWKLALFDLAALFLANYANDVDDAITSLGGPGPLSAESTDDAVLGHHNVPDSVGAWIRQGTTLTGGIKVPNLTLVVATLVVKLWP